MKTQILTTLILLLLVGCDKDDDTNEFTPTLPAATQTGANTFGCYIGGVLLIPRNGSGANGFPDTGMTYSVGGIPPNITYSEIIVKDYASERTGKITMHFKNLNDLGSGNYIVNESNCQDNVDSPITTNIFCRVYDSSQGIYKNYCSFENSGTIIITKYEDAIISGTFNATLKCLNDPSDKIEITQGRFDINRATVSLTYYP